MIKRNKKSIVEKYYTDLESLKKFLQQSLMLCSSGNTTYLTCVRSYNSLCDRCSKLVDTDEEKYLVYALTRQTSHPYDSKQNKSFIALSKEVLDAKENIFLPFIKDLKKAVNADIILANDDGVIKLRNGHTKRTFQKNTIIVKSCNKITYDSQSKEVYNDGGLTYASTSIFNNIAITPYRLDGDVIVMEISSYNLLQIIKDYKTLSSFYRVKTIKAWRKDLEKTELAKFINDNKREASNTDTNIQHSQQQIKTFTKALENDNKLLEKLKKESTDASGVIEKSFTIFEDNIDMLLKDKRIKSIAFFADTLKVTTNDILFPKDSLVLNEDGDTNKVAINIGKQIINILPSGVTIVGVKHSHPHVSHGNICLGNIETDFREYLRTRNYFSLIYLLLEFLQSYNERSAYYRLDRLLDDSDQPYDSDEDGEDGNYDYGDEDDNNDDE